jgi:hypothetical protein
MQLLLFRFVGCVHVAEIGFAVFRVVFFSADCSKRICFTVRLSFTRRLLLMHPAIKSSMLQTIGLLFSVLIMPVLIFIYCLSSYKRALSMASDAWWMRLGFGRAFLHFTLTRLPAKSIDKAMQAEGRAASQDMEATPPPMGGVAFVGSSTFTYWRHLQSDMVAKGVSIPCFNAAFGGSWTKHVLQFADELCFKHMPRAVVYFCGTNDLNTGQPPSVAAQGFIAFHRALLAALPSTPIVYVAPTATPYVAWRRESHRFFEASRLVRRYVETLQSGSVLVVDPNQSPVFTDMGMYLGDQHHLNDEGHRQLAALLAPALAALNAAAPDAQ